MERRHAFCPIFPDPTSSGVSFRRLTLAYFALCLILGACAHTPQTETAPPVAYTTPTRALVLIFSDLMPEDIERYGLVTFRDFQAGALSFSNAWVGHLTAHRIVSLPVLTSGLSPRHLPWQDEIVEVGPEKLSGKTASTPVRASRRGPPHFLQLSRQTPELIDESLLTTSATSLPSRLKNGPGHGPVIAIAETPELAAALGGPASQAIVPSGQARSVVTPSGALALGNDELGIAQEVIYQMKQKPDWKALFVHVGAADAPKTTNELELAAKLQREDKALALILATLNELGLSRETALVITADHGRMTPRVPTPSSRAAARTLVAGAPSTPQAAAAACPSNPELQHLLTPTWVRYYALDSLLRFWLQETDRVSVAKFEAQLRAVPGVAEIYTKQVTGTSVHYIRTFRSPLLQGEALAWADAHGSALLESMAAPAAPQVVALGMEEWTAAPRAEQGGAQRSLQRVPLMVRSPNLKIGENAESATPLRTVDINPLLCRLLGIAEPETLDGNADTVANWIVGRR